MDNHILHIGDTILDIQNRIGIIKYINTGKDEKGNDFWESLVYYPAENQAYTMYRSEITYKLMKV